MKELQLLVARSDHCLGNNSDPERSERLGDRGYLYTADDYRSSGCLGEESGGFNRLIRIEAALCSLNEEKAITRKLLKEP